MDPAKRLKELGFYVLEDEEKVVKATQKLLPVLTLPTLK